MLLRLPYTILHEYIVFLSGLPVPIWSKVSTGALFLAVLPVGSPWRVLVGVPCFVLFIPMLLRLPHTIHNEYIVSLSGLPVPIQSKVSTGALFLAVLPIGSHWRVRVEVPCFVLFIPMLLRLPHTILHEYIVSLSCLPVPIRSKVSTGA